MNKQKNKILTISDLVKFCETNKFSKFSSKDTGYRLSVQVPTTFESVEENSMDGLMRLKIKTSHTLKNRNGSFISEEAAKDAMPSLKMRPVLAAIHQLDSGEWDFDAHNMEIVENENGEEEINYIEKQVGAFTQEEPFLEYDENEDKTYICAYAAIPEEYTKAASIIRSKGGTKVSCEILIDSFSYNAKEKFLNIEKYRYEGVTLLGTHKYADGTEEEVGEGMLGSRADIEDFSVENNSMFSHTEINNKLVDTLEKLNSTLQSFNINNTGRKEEVIVEKDEKFEEEVTVEVTETEEETVVESTEEEAVTETEEQSEETVDETPNETVEETEEVEFSSSRTIDKLENYTRIIYEISHEDIRSAIYTLISPFEEEINDWLYITNVYNDHFICENWSGTNVYGCKYKTEDDNVSLDGEFYQLFKEVLTVEEKAKLDEMRSNYSAIQEKLNKYEKAELDEQKTAIFEDDSYSEYLETEEFKSLIADKDKYSVDELKDKAEIAFAKCVKKAGKFSANTSEHEDKKSSRHVFSKANSKEKKKSPYGNIFNKD